VALAKDTTITNTEPNASKLSRFGARTSRTLCSRVKAWRCYADLSSACGRATAPA
jgi:hypothetical protein